MREDSEAMKQRDDEVGLTEDIMFHFYRFAKGSLIGLPLACVAVILVTVFTGNKTAAIALGSGICFTIALVIMMFWERLWGKV